MTKHDLFDVLQDPYTPLTEAQIRAVEREIGLHFPDDYVSFLLRNNGGYCQHTVEFVTKTPLSLGRSDGRIGIRKFFAITDNPREFNDIRSHTPLDKLTDDAIPQNLVPFADAYAPDCFCLVGKGTDFGKVYFWTNDDGGARLVAPSFTAFLERVMLPEDRTWNLPDPDVDSTPVFRAIRYGDIEAIREYLDGGGDANRMTNDGTTLMMCAAHARWPRILELILSRGADWRLRDKNGRDSLWFAVGAQSITETKLLLDVGADPNTRDNMGEAPLDMLMGDRLRALLVKHGARPTIDNHGESEPD